MRQELDEYFKECPDTHWGAIVTEGDTCKIAMNSTAYLPLFRHPRVLEAVRSNLDLYGVGAGSRYNMGHVRVVRELEERLAALAGVEEAVLFPSGYNLNLGLNSPAFGERPYFFADQRNHPSILSGIRLSAAEHMGGNWGANCSRYVTNDMANLEAFLKAHQDKPNRWIISVGTYGPTGERADLPGLDALARTYGARVYLDDVHFYWVLGPHLGGLCDECGVRVDVLMGSFKAFGMPGAFALGDKAVVGQLRFAEAYIFSIGLLPILAAAASAAIDVALNDEGREMVARLWANVADLRARLRTAGFQPLSDRSQLIAFRIEGEERALRFIRRTKDLGLIVQPYFHPAVPRGVGHARLTPIASHTAEHIDRTVAIMTQAGHETGLI
jgi:7-keto-8-aminopelargonate synthetase-like enzyme